MVDTRATEMTNITKVKRKRYQFETFCYGPKNCSFYKAGATHKVRGRSGMTWGVELNCVAAYKRLKIAEICGFNEYADHFKDPDDNHLEIRCPADL